MLQYYDLNIIVGVMAAQLELLQIESEKEAEKAAEAEAELRRYFQKQCFMNLGLWRGCCGIWSCSHQCRPPDSGTHGYLLVVLQGDC